MSGNKPKAAQIGAELKVAREAAGLGLRELAERLAVGPSTVSRWENGQRTPKPNDITRYLTEVDAPDDQIVDILQLAQDPEDDSPWLSVSLPDQHRQLAALLELERTATTITAVSPMLVPGPLQTGDYARAIMTAAKVPADEIDMRVAVRIGRREAITRKRPARLTALIGEGVLRQDIGGSEVMADQLRSLLEASRMPNIDLRVIPHCTDWHPGMEGPFVLVGFDDRTPVVQIENRRSALFFHQPEDVDAYVQAVDMIVDVAMSPQDSAKLIEEALAMMETTS